MSEQNKSRVKREFTQHIVVFTLKNGKEIEKVIKKRDLESILAVKPKNAVSAKVYSQYVIEVKGLGMGNETSAAICLEDENYKEEDIFVFGEVVGFEEIALNVKPMDLVDFILDTTFTGEVGNNEYTKQKFVKGDGKYFPLPENFTKV